MTDINFYVSKQEGREGLKHRLNIVYKLVSVALQRGLSVYIYTDQNETSMQVDDMLWSSDKTSFIPHTVITSSNHEISTDLATEVVIFHNYVPQQTCDYLINLSNLRPEFFSRFLKVAEILDTSEEILTAGRKRYAFYRDRGYTLKYHQL
jgi:DNA polymerase-3 subunit chi